MLGAISVGPGRPRHFVVCARTPIKCRRRRRMAFVGKRKNSHLFRHRFAACQSNGGERRVAGRILPAIRMAKCECQAKPILFLHFRLANWRDNRKTFNFRRRHLIQFACRRQPGSVCTDSLFQYCFPVDRSVGRLMIDGGGRMQTARTPFVTQSRPSLAYNLASGRPAVRPLSDTRQSRSAQSNALRNSRLTENFTPN